MVAQPVRVQIIDAAARCFAKRGSDNTSIDDIARYLGATKGKVYHHFRSKAELILVVRLRSVEIKFESVKPFFDKKLNPENQFYEMAYAHVRSLVDRFYYHQVVIEGLRLPVSKSMTDFERTLIRDLIDLQYRYEEMFRVVIEDGIKRGIFRDQSISFALRCILMLLSTPVFWFAPQDGDSEEKFHKIAKQVASLAVSALGFSEVHRLTNNRKV